MQRLLSPSCSPKAALAVTVEGGRLVLTPARPRYSLDDLVAGMKPGDLPAGPWVDRRWACRARSVVTRRAARAIQRGDIIGLDFDPSAGHEQQGTRPALVLSPEAFNRLGMALACPVTRGGAFARGLAWTVPLAGAGLTTEGVVLCNQLRTVDLVARRAVFIEAAQTDLVADVLARVATLIE